MSTEMRSTLGMPDPALAGEQLRKEFQHLRSCWWCFLLLGILLVVTGTAAIIFPIFTVGATLTAMLVLGIILLVSGIATIVTAFWAGKWSGMLLQLLVGILYVVAGWVILETPVEAAATLTLLIAAFLIVGGAFRIVSSFAIRFPHWGWALLNGVITLLAGVIIYKRFPTS